jgi:hypothetical protein
MQKQDLFCGLIHRQPTLFRRAFWLFLWVGLLLTTPLIGQTQPCTPAISGPTGATISAGNPPVASTSALTICQGQPVSMTVAGCPIYTILPITGPNSLSGTGPGFVFIGTGFTGFPQTSDQPIVQVTDGNLQLGSYTFSLRCQNSFGCVSTETSPFTLVVTAEPGTVVSTGFNPTCPSEGPILGTLACSSGTLQYGYSINGIIHTGFTNPNVSLPNIAGVYSLTARCTTGGSCLGLLNSITIRNKTRPASPVNQQITQSLLCIGQSATLTAGCSISAIWYVAGTNQPASGTAVGTTGLIVLPFDVGTYSYQPACVDPAADCPAPHDDTPLSLTVLPLPTAPAITPGENLSACVGERILLTATCPVGTARFKRGVLSQDAATEVVVASEPGTVIYQVSCFVNTVESSPAMAQVVFRAVPASLQILQTGQLCTDLPGSVTLSATGGTDPPVSHYSWSTGETTQRIEVNAAGLYSVNGANDAGCVTTASQLLAANPCGVATAIQVLTATITCTDGQIQIMASGGNGNPIQYSVGGVQYAANNGIMLDPAIQNNADSAHVQLFVRQVNSDNSGFDMGIPFLFDFRAACPGTGQTVEIPLAPITPLTTTVCGSPASTIGQPLVITGVADINCTNGTFRILTTGGNGQPINFAGIVGLSNADPYNCVRGLDTPDLIRQVNNPTSTVAPFQLRVLNVGGSTSPVFAVNFKQVCTGVSRLGLSTEANPLEVTVLGNPTLSEWAEIEVVGAAGGPLWLRLVDGLGTVISEQRVEQAGAVERQRLRLSHSAGLYLLRVSTPGQSKTVNVVRQ